MQQTNKNSPKNGETQRHSQEWREEEGKNMVTASIVIEVRNKEVWTLDVQEEESRGYGWGVVCHGAQGCCLIWIHVYVWYEFMFDMNSCLCLIWIHVWYEFMFMFDMNSCLIWIHVYVWYEFMFDMHSCLCLIWIHVYVWYEFMFDMNSCLCLIWIHVYVWYEFMFDMNSCLCLIWIHVFLFQSSGAEGVAGYRYSEIKASGGM